ncbi:MAG TPA: FCD domain-containing protein [Bryobacteraceae bacterium]|nr:FCD domain-containing protein [Bryobacteraceae bacterium]
MIRRRTLTSQVIDHILEQIKSGQVKAGERLPTEKQLTATLQVSRTCVREAMKSLESLGLVRIRPRVGAIVQEPTPASILSAEEFSQDIQQERTDRLLEFRMIVEVGLASLAAERADTRDLAAMESALERYRKEMQTANAVDCRTDLAFHAALAAASKNPLGQSVWRMISARLAEVLERNSTVPDVYPNTLRDHLRIFRAVKERDPRKARLAMQEHLENADRVTRVALCESQDGSGPRAARLPKALPG